MIKKWLISNFKSVREETILDLCPLTVISGSNSSGKSTVLQSILLISQTLQARFKRQHLITNGELVRLGTPDEIVHFEQSNRPLVLAGILNFDYDSSVSRSYNPELNLPKSKEITFDLTFKLDNKKTPTGPTFILSEALFQRTISKDYSVSLRLRRKKNPTNMEFDYEVINSEPEGLFPSNIAGMNTIQFIPNQYQFEKKIDAIFQEELSQIAGQVDSVRYRSDIIEAEYNRPLGPEVMGFLSYVSEDNRKLYTKNLLESLVNARRVSELVSFAQELYQQDRDLFLEFVTQLRNPVRIRQMVQILGSESRFVEESCPPRVKQGMAELQQYFEHQIHYLGPLRDDPRVIYAIPTNVEFRNVGLKGEFTAAMLNQYRSLSVPYPVPSQDPQQVTCTIDQAPLVDAVGAWLKHMGLVDTVDVREVTNIGYELSVQQSGANRGLALTRVGVGVSQILPTLVMCLLAPTPCTLLIEQPELHLHPKVQSILGDFFLGLTYCGKQCIVETHSEHIINRLLKRIAQDEVVAVGDIGLRNRIGILFVEKTGTSSIFRRVEPNEYGVIPENQWPKGFMDQASIEIQQKLEAAKNKRRALLNLKK